MRRASQRESEFTKLQNQFRGIISTLRSSQFQSVKSDTPVAQRFQASVTDLFLAARIGLKPDQYSNFLSWVDQQKTLLLGDFLGTSKAYEYLSGVGSSKSADLKIELLWMTALLQRNVTELTRFRKMVSEMQHLVLSDDFAAAILVLDQVDQIWGVSLWSVQARIAFTNELGGLEAQKRVVANFQSIFERGLLGFVAYHCGVRNESRTTAERFASATAARVDNHPYFSREVKIYLKRVLIGETPKTPQSAASTLRVSQSHHFIDQYEELISLAQCFTQDQNLNEFKPDIVAALHSLSAVDDFRIKKLLQRFDPNNVSIVLPSRTECLLTHILTGDSRRAMRLFAARQSEQTTDDVWDFIYLGWVAADGVFKDSKEKRIRRRIVRFISAMFTNTELFDPHDALVKLSRNLGQLPIFASLWTYSNLINSDQFMADIDHSIVGLNSKNHGPEDAPDLTTLEQFLNVDQEISSVSKLWLAYHGGCDALNGEPIQICLARALGASARGELQEGEAFENLEDRSQFEGTLLGFRDIAKLDNSVRTYRKSEIITTIAEACSHSTHSPVKHKITRATDGFVWRDFAECEDAVLRSVALHLKWSQCPDSPTASMLRFSLSSYLKSISVDRPSDIEFDKNITESDAVNYFLRHVCVSDTLDAVKSLRGSRQVLEERANICRVLQVRDATHKYLYEEEAADVQQQLSFADGLLIVDSSRIYVETPLFRRWAQKQVAEDHARFRDLAKVEIDNFRPFDELISEISNNSTRGHTPFIPENEADVLLYRILVRLKDEFLTNSTFGLDFFLSKRIRHQSFIGSIRGPLEFADLITNRVDQNSPYKPNYHWVNKLAVSNPSARTDLLAAFETFAEKFDTALLEAKDRFFQLRTKETPNGLIFLGLTTNIVELVKSMVPLDSSFDSFLDTVEALLWIGLEPALTLSRSFITDELKGTLTSAADELRASVRLAIGNSGEFLVFDAEIGKRSREVQNKLDESAGWFTRTNLDFAEKSFELDEAIDMAQKFALACLPGFEPVLVPSNVTADTRIRAPSLVHLHDQLLIALQNAKEHSGLKNPRITTSAVADSDEGLLQIRVESEVKASALDAARSGASEKRKLIAEGKSVFRSRKEGGSGFFKLAAVTSQSSKGSLQFGVTELGNFFLDVQYSLVMLETES